MKVCVVGGGVAGIIAVKHLLQRQVQFDAFEMTHRLGGTWVYTEEEHDAFGQPVQTCMYKNLRTNLPKEVMEFQNFQYNSKKSFLDSAEVLKYLMDFVQEFKIDQHFKLGHVVKRIKRNGNDWEVTVKDLREKKEMVFHYDAIIVCNGHFSEARYPQLKGADSFQGRVFHSKEYRTPDSFRERTVLVVGFGPSGQDIAVDLSSRASKVLLSHHAPGFNREFFPPNVVPKPDVESVTAHSVSFTDGSSELVDDILYCTGFHYRFPFLDETCGVTVESDYVRPLFRHLININQPTMFFIGLRFRTFLFPLFEMQVKTVLDLLQEPSLVPSPQEMRSELQRDEAAKLQLPKHKYHMVADVKEYVEQVRSLGRAAPLPEVLYKVYEHTAQQRASNIRDYRSYVYTILDDHTFSVL